MHDGCNKHAKIPKHIVVWLHNLTGYDGKVVLKAIQELQNPNGPYYKLPAMELEKQSEALYNEPLVKWMRGQTDAWCESNRHKSTWLRAIREIRQAPKIESHAAINPENSKHDSGIRIHGVGPAVCEFLKQAPESAWGGSGKQVRHRPSEKTIGSLKLKVISKTSERYSMIQFGPLRFQDSANFLKA